MISLVRWSKDNASVTFSFIPPSPLIYKRSNLNGRVN